MVSVWNLLLAAPALASAARLYGQCGGIGYRGSKNCPRGAACIEQSRSLHLCLPGNMATTTAPTTTALPTATPVPPSEKYLITFGDSYSQTGFNVSLAPPSPANPLGNPPLPGWTASGGLNWVGFLASRYNATTLLTYNFAYGGATTNASLVAPWRPDVLSLVDQVAQFSASIASKPEHAKWTGENALFGVWIGVNDVGNSWWLEGYDGLVERIMDTYFGQLEILYGSGARRFVLLTVPPIHKTPAVLANPVEAQEAEKVSIDKYNTRVAERWEEFKRAREGVQGLVVDTTVPFEKALANPTAYGAADATCYNQDGVSCLWFNDYHPGVAINQLVAEAVAEAWKGVFFK